MMTWTAARHSPGHGHSLPPVAFLDELLTILKPLPDSLFEPNANRDLYSLLAPVLGPWSSTAHRKAAMADALVMDGMFESDANWNEGADTTAGQETVDQIETGLWQVSKDSTFLDASLRAFIVEKLGTANSLTFIAAMKENHALAVEYVIRLFRVNTRWSGPCNTGIVAGAVTRAAVNEWQIALASIADSV